MQVYVTNLSQIELVDGFQGVSYSFMPGQTVEIPSDAAAHIFGYGEADKEPFLVRLGWIKMKQDMPEGLKRLAQFEISEQPPVKKNHSLSPLVVEKVPLPGDARARGKLRSLNA